MGGCFETFPFPVSDPRVDIATLEPAVTDPAIVTLRDLHVEMDRAVLEAYGWSDIEILPYTTPQTPAEKDARQAFEDEVIDRLFALNAERAAEERKVGSPEQAAPSQPTSAAPSRAKTTRPSTCLIEL